MYKKTDAKVNFAQIEKDVLNFWKENKTFEKSINIRSEAEDFTFYDGPPFANGTPHYGHMLQSFIKDTVARFQTQQGKRVLRKAGWDCHGLPAEMGAEKGLGIAGKQAIEEHGIDKFNEYCRKDVMKYADIWTEVFDRMGRWVDYNDDYKTMDLPYMESVINNFKQLWDKGLIYEDYRVLPYSWAAETSLSNFEVNQGYKDRTDAAITVKFELETGERILVWTTTPWTLPSNLALAMSPELEYATFEKSGEKIIISNHEGTLKKYKKQLEGWEKIDVQKGEKYIGLSYTPMFDYFADKKEEGAFKVISGDFIEEGSGTATVHIAPGFGEDDLRICREYKKTFPVVCPIDERANFTSEVRDYIGMNVFAANETIIHFLKEEDILFKKEQYTHSYPHCDRTDEPLIYRVMSSWFVKVEENREELIKNNKQITWFPSHIKEGRFGKWLEGARDWDISRKRFWGAPIPVWRSDNPDFPRLDVFGSIEEIKKASGIEVKDLHRPYIDNVVYPNPDDPSGKTMMRRVPDVLDCWFESGSMPYAQNHYPFENKEHFENNFPADFIVEGLDQTRGWFYTLTILGSLLHKKPAFLNCICTGLIMAADGRKMSKRWKNYTDPTELMDKESADALRWFLISSPVVKGEQVNLSDEAVRKTARASQVPFYNAYHFFTLYANADNITAEEKYDSKDTMDKYILLKLKELSEDVQKALLTYELGIACKKCEAFLEILNNWYIRRSRERFWGTSVSKDVQKEAFNTLYTVLVNLSKIMAPLMPFTAEEIFKNLTNEESVHLTLYPQIELDFDKSLAERMDKVRNICSASKNIREEEELRNRLPLQDIKIAGTNLQDLKDLLDIIKEESNVKKVILEDNFSEYADKFLYVLTPIVGKRLGKYLGQIIPASKKGEYEILDGKCHIAGQILNENEFEERLQLKDGIKGRALPDNTAIVILNTETTAELEKEGLARDFVRTIQDIRKAKDFNISDRIEIDFNTSDELLKEAIKENANYISEQVLAISINEKNGFNGEKTEINKKEIEINVTR
ncbi:MAG: isoleucine--tRNA ligase [Alphaproteobacteria bacterium]|jgi:isoleucyl-tRNA synthetase|nr:isoleucine--tRNA ligase [Alphaproteobacteria bacterium]